MRFVTTGPGSGPLSIRWLSQSDSRLIRGRTVVSVHQVVRDFHGGVVSVGMVVHVYRIQDGLLRSMEIV
jgi:hypothetical protein